MANSVDPDETPRSAASHLGLYCLFRRVCPNTYGKYGMKTCQILCTLEYHSVYQSMMQGMEGLQFMLEYQHIYTYCLKHCYLWKVMFSDGCLKK